MLEHAMLAAVESAQEGIIKGEGGPFGAAIVMDAKVIATGHNTVLKDRDPTCHAEMNAIRKASKVLGNHVLSACTLYTTAEPCPMCLAAILWARIPTVVVGVSRQVAAQYGFDDALFYEQLALPDTKKMIKIQTGYCPVQCEGLFKTWQEKEGAIY